MSHKNTKTRLQDSTTKRAPKTAQINRTTQLVTDATIDLLREGGYRALTIDQVSQRSGVTRSTIYRHWSSVGELVAQVFDLLMGPMHEVVDTGNVCKDLQLMVEDLADSLDGSIWGDFLPTLIEASHNDPKFKGIVGQIADSRRDNARQMLLRAKQRGQLKSEINVDWMLDAIAGPLYHRLLISGRSVEDRLFLKQLVDGILAVTLVPDERDNSEDECADK